MQGQQTKKTLKKWNTPAKLRKELRKKQTRQPRERTPKIAKIVQEKQALENYASSKRSDFFPAVRERVSHLTIKLTIEITNKIK